MGRGCTRAGGEGGGAGYGRDEVGNSFDDDDDDDDKIRHSTEYKKRSHRMLRLESCAAEFQRADRE